MSFIEQARASFASLLEEAAQVQIEIRELCELIDRRGQTISVRELRDARYRYRRDGAEEALERLVRLGFAEWIQSIGPRGGRGKRRVRLSAHGLFGFAVLRDIAREPRLGIAELPNVGPLHLPARVKASDRGRAGGDRDG